MKNSNTYLVEKCPRISIYQAIRQAHYDKKAYIPYLVKMTVESVIDGFPLKEEVGFAHSKTNFNGLRVWFSCPKCFNRVRDLYVRKDFHSWWCRKCHELKYSSQNRHREWAYECIEKYSIGRGKIVTKLKNKFLRIPTKIKLNLLYQRLEVEALNKLGQYLSKKFTWK